MTCRELLAFIADYLAGELLPETTVQFEHHVSVCPNCRVYLSNYRDTIRLGRQVFADQDAEVPADVPDELVEAILASRRA